MMRIRTLFAAMALLAWIGPASAQTFPGFCTGVMSGSGGLPGCSTTLPSGLTATLPLSLFETGTINLSNLSQNQLQFQGTGNSNTTSISLNPGTGTLPTGTISELIADRTALQAFGGNYGRLSLTAQGTALSNETGFFGEFGGTTATGAMGPFLFQNGVENPPNTFTTTEFWRVNTISGGTEDTNLGNMVIGLGSTPINSPVLETLAPLTAGTTDSNRLTWIGHSFDGTTTRAVMWRSFGNVTSQAGASTWRLQHNLNGAGWTDILLAPDNVALDLPSGAGTAGAALTSSGSGSTQATWQIPARMRYCLIGVNFNSANTDNALSISPLPTVRWAAGNVRITNASASISSATIGVFTATGGGGQTIAANQAITVTASATDSNNNTMALNLTNSTTEAYNDTSVQVRVGTAQGSAATADVCLEIVPLT